MKLAASLAFMFAMILPASAQDTFGQDSTQSEKPIKFYCEITEYNNIGSGVNIDFDFGENTNTISPFRDDSHIHANGAGKEIEFNSIVDAMNYMSQRGWELSAFLIDNENRNHCIMYKSALDIAQAREGTLTKREFKKRRKTVRKNKSHESQNLSYSGGHSPAFAFRPNP